MYIRRVINQYHCDKIKEYPHVDHQIKKHFYFQYIKTCLWLLVFFGDKIQKLSTLPCFHPIKNHSNTLWVFTSKLKTTVLFDYNCNYLVTKITM
jgi:hypothetical protein